MDQNLLNEIANIDELLAKKYNLYTNEECPKDYRAIAWLQTDITAAVVNSDDSIKTIEEIRNIINTSKYPEEILEVVSFAKANKESYIRKNWEESLQNVENGSDLSRDIGWGLSHKDLCKLATIYQSGKKKMKEKIEDLLTDCNFHTECSDFINGSFDAYRS